MKRVLLQNEIKTKLYTQPAGKFSDAIKMNCKYIEDDEKCP